MVKKCLTLVFTNRPTNGYTGNIYTLQVTSEITETVDAVTETCLLILAEIKRGELITQMTVTGAGTETSRTCKQCTNGLWIYLGLQNFLKKMDNFLGWNVDVGSRQWRKWLIDFS